MQTNSNSECKLELLKRKVLWALESQGIIKQSWYFWIYWWLNWWITRRLLAKVLTNRHKVATCSDKTERIRERAKFGSIFAYELYFRIYFRIAIIHTPTSKPDFCIPFRLLAFPPLQLAIRWYRTLQNLLTTLVTATATPYFKDPLSY